MNLYDRARVHGEATPEDAPMERSEARPIFRVVPANKGVRVINGRKEVREGWFEHRRPDDEPFLIENIVGVFLGTRDTKAFFEEAAETPSCRSDFGGVGIGDPGGDCSKCPLMTFRVARGEKRRCRNNRHYVFYVPGFSEELEVVEIAIPGGGISGSNNAMGRFQNGAMKAGIKPYSVAIVLGTQAVRNAEGQTDSYPLTVSIDLEDGARVLTAEEFARAEVLFRDCQEWLRVGKESEGVLKPHMALPAPVARPALPDTAPPAAPAEDKHEYPSFDEIGLMAYSELCTLTQRWSVAALDDAYEATAEREHLLASVAGALLKRNPATVKTLRTVCRYLADNGVAFEAPAEMVFCDQVAE